MHKQTILVVLKPDSSGNVLKIAPWPERKVFIKSVDTLELQMFVWPLPSAIVALRTWVRASMSILFSST